MMRTKMLLSAVVVLLIFTVSGTTYAGENAILAANNQFSVQYVANHVDYGETGNGVPGTSTGLLDTEKGYVNGYGFHFSMMGSKLIDNGYIDIQISNVKGHTKYVGALIGGAYGSVVASSSAQIADYSLRLGKGFLLGEHFMFTPFLELGYHRWYRGVNDGETYRHDYYGGGALAQVSFANSFVLSVNGMIGETFRPTIYVNLPYPLSFTHSLGSSETWRVGATADYAVAGNLHINVGVGYTRFKYGFSGLVSVPGGYIWEPDSSTKYIAYKAGIGYAF